MNGTEWKTGRRVWDNTGKNSETKCVSLWAKPKTQILPVKNLKCEGEFDSQCNPPKKISLEKSVRDWIIAIYHIFKNYLLLQFNSTFICGLFWTWSSNRNNPATENFLFWRSKNLGGILLCKCHGGDEHRDQTRDNK